MISVVIPSAGLGKRIGLKKQYYLLNKKPILAYTLSIFQNNPLVSEIILTVPKDDIQFSTNNIVAKYKFDKVQNIVAGGKTRQISVHNGIKACDPKTDYILIHDAVRPFFDIKLIAKLVNEVKKYKAVVTALPARDTIKIVSSNKIILNTPPRKDIFQAQTPQIFSHDLINKAFQKALKDKFTGTDDSSLVERMGRKVKIFTGNEENIKITTPNDLAIAEILVRKLKMKVG